MPRGRASGRLEGAKAAFRTFIAPAFQDCPGGVHPHTAAVTTRTLLLALALSLSTATVAPAAVSLGTGADAPIAPPTVAEGPAKAAIDAYREGRQSIGVDLAKPLAEKGNADALFLLGFAAETGQGLPSSRDAALEYYKKAAAAGHKDATYRRALILLNSKEDKDRQEGREGLENAAKTDPANAGRILGEAWLRGLLSEKPDADKAADWWSKASEAGDTPSILILARFYEGAFGFPEKTDAKRSLERRRRRQFPTESTNGAPRTVRIARTATDPTHGD